MRALGEGVKGNKGEALLEIILLSEGRIRAGRVAPVV
jgi:hypothetical protein